MSVRKIHYVCIHLNLGTADVFAPALIAGASDQLWESLLSIAKTSAQLEHAKHQQQIAAEAQKQQWEWATRQARARVWAAMAAQREKDKQKKGTEDPPKKARKDPAVAGVDDEDADDEEEDLEEVLEKGKCKQTIKSLYKQLPTMARYATTS